MLETLSHLLNHHSLLPCDGHHKQSTNIDHHFVKFVHVQICLFQCFGLVVCPGVCAIIYLFGWLLFLGVI